MVPTLSYTNVSISIVLVLVHKCIVYQQIVEFCCEVLTFYCCNKYCLYQSFHVTNIVYISLSISELREHVPSYCSLLWYTKSIVYQQNYYKICAESLNSTCLQSFVHLCIQIIELQELACRCNVWAEVGFCGFPKMKMFTQLLLCLLSARHQTLLLHQVSDVGLFRLVRFASSTEEGEEEEEEEEKEDEQFKKWLFLI